VAEVSARVGRLREKVPRASDAAAKHAHRPAKGA